MLADIFFLFLGVILVLYLVTDGFDLGVGVLCLIERDERSRDELMYSIEGVWHANQTWLVIAGGVLFGAFPLVYGSVLAALYIPTMLMLFTLMVRGVCLEYRAEAENKRLFAFLFGLGSLGAALSQGALLGAVLQGVPLDNGEFTGSAWDWLTPFSALTAIALTCAYTMLGGFWTALKTEGRLKASGLLWGRVGAASGLGVFVVLLVLVVATQGLAHLREALFAFGPLVCFLLAVGAIVMLFASASKGRPGPAFGWAVASVAAMAVGFAWGLYPVMAPPSLTVANAASPPDMLEIMLWVIGGLFPVLLFYNGYQYRVFRGKMGTEEH